MTVTNALLIDEAQVFEDQAYDVVVFTDAEAVYLRTQDGSQITITYDDFVSIVRLVSTEQGWASAEILALAEAIGEDIVLDVLSEKNESV